MASPLTIQPSGKDNWFYEGAATTNYGTAASFSVGRYFAGYIRRALVEFGITWGTDIPAGATITSATLYLYYYDQYGDPVGRTYYAQRLLRLDWHETQSTWNIYKTGSNWSTAGAASEGNDYEADDQASATVPASYGWMAWNVLNQVKAAQTGNLQIAFRIVDSAEDANVMAGFYSREEATQTTLRPKLVIEYTLAVVGRSFGLIIG